MLRRQAQDRWTQIGDVRRRLPARLSASRPPRLGLTGLSMARRYLLLSLVFVVIGGGVVAYALGQLIETSAINRTTSITALYVESFVAPQLQSLRTSTGLSQTEIDSLKSLLSDSPLGQRIVSIRIWSPDGRILYSPLPELIGQRFDMTGDRALAAAGAVTGDISDLSDPENVYEAQHWDRLIEIYLPVRATGSSQIVAVAEFYQLADELEAEVNRDRLIAWALVAGATILAYVALARVVRQGSETILRQEGELRERVGQLSTLLDQNARLSDRIRQAAARSTALTELERRRIGVDLHDGPSQSLAFALLRLDSVEGRLEGAEQGDADLEAVRDALQAALMDMRTIAAGLRSPELDQAHPVEIIRRAVADHERRAGTSVRLDLRDVPSTAPLATKIALFRILSEALSNAARHGGGSDVEVIVRTSDDGSLVLEVGDHGPGFDPSQVPAAGHLGLAGMRERAELLGGRFELESAPGRGARVRAFLPLGGVAGER